MNIMKTLYFAAPSGISGNMTLAALLEIIEDDNYLLNELKKLHLDGYEIIIKKTNKNHIHAKHVEVKVEESHVHRHLIDINKIIDDSDLNFNVKSLAKKIFLAVAKAESKVHDIDIDEVHFHEVGALDSIIDIVGTAILIDKIRPDKIYGGEINEGKGFINCAHGLMAVPVPATLEILKEHQIPFKQIDVETELITPTGAAIFATLVEKVQDMPKGKIIKTGYGAGTKDIKVPNILIALLLEEEVKMNEEEVYVLNTNIDDTTGEILAYVQEKLISLGALDVSFSPLYMKKNRPAYKLEVILKPGDLNKISEVILLETSSIGIRYRKEKRLTLKREEVRIDSIYGTLIGKKVYTSNGIKIYPEFESLKEIAKKNNVALKDLYDLFIRITSDGN